ncbi:MAG TPA: DUF542 domain-containing protein [Agriterribacter sp.]|nr:DUF542 domain-containing protein [Agriterribacter sp.]
MESSVKHIKPGDYIFDIVKKDYRTADVFRKYQIDYCCGGKWPLSMICETKQIETAAILEELNRSVQDVPFSQMIDVTKWGIDFLADFITHMHHDYFKVALPDTIALTKSFTAKHEKQLPQLQKLNGLLQELSGTILEGVKRKDEILFPYVRQIAHAYLSKETYARLLARTLRKPLEEPMQAENRNVVEMLSQIRQCTNDYTPPPNACISHRVTFARLQELHNVIQHNRYMEQDVLYPKALAIERELTLAE